MNKKPTKSKDLVKTTEEALGKLSVGVQNLGSVLGAKPETVKAEIKNPHKPDVELSQEEKIAQRQAKAAAKKAKAESAAAKKAQPQNGAAPKSQEPKSTTSKPIQPNGTTPKTEIKKENGKNQTKQEEKTVKSALKAPTVPSTIGKEVQFDLPAKRTHRISESEDSYVLDIPVVPLGNASSTENVDPAFLTLVARCEKDLIDDIEQLCAEFIEAFKKFSHDWSDKRSKMDPTTFGKSLEVDIRPQISYLTDGGKWPLPYALGNIVRQLKREFKDFHYSTMEENTSKLNDYLDESLRSNFELANSSIFSHIEPKLANLKSVLTYSWCPVVNSILLEALSKNSDFKVCVVDSELKGKGIKQVNSIVESGQHCEYTDLRSVGAIISKYSFVLLGCSAILSNGCVAAAKGAAQIALLAKAFNKPVLVAAQSFKFVDKVQHYPKTALLHNDSIELIPASLVTAVVTDIRILAPTAAPAVLKAKALDLDG